MTGDCLVTVIVCLEDGCGESKIVARGYCGPHYQKRWRAGLFAELQKQRSTAEVNYRNSQGQKQCANCLVFQDEDCFGRAKGSSDGLNLYCKKCASYFRLVNRWGERAVALIEAGCEVCGKTQGQICVDHNHSCCPGQKSCGECIRGILCQKCNHGIGLFDDDADRMMAAINYLAKVKEKVK